MKIRSIFAIATVLVLVATIGAQSALAQSQSLRANVPFEFYAGGKLHPAGIYTLVQVTPTTLRLEDARGRAVFISAERESARMNDNNWFVFHQYGDRSFLSGAYWSGYGNSLKVPESRAEQEIARNGAPAKPLAIAAK